MGEDIKVLRLTNNTESKIELAQKLLKVYCELSNMSVGESDLVILSYFMVYGFKRETKELIVRSKIVGLGTLNNVLSRLRKSGLIKKVEFGGTSMCDELNFPIESKMGLIIKLQNV